MKITSANMRPIGLLIGALLLAAAIVIVWRQRETVERALHALGDLPAGTLAFHIGVLAGTVILNLAMTGLLFSLLISRYGKVGWLEMQALIASSTLMNYLPLRPGLLGRVAYHKTVNGIAVIDSLKTVMQAITLSAIVTGYVALAVLAAGRLGMNLQWLLAAPVPLLLGGALAKGLCKRTLRIYLLAALVRYFEIAVIALRYHAAFALLGLPIDSSEALAFACVSMIAGMVPFLSNGLGLREWAIGATAHLLTQQALALGITADLLTRAAELVVVLACGLMGIAFLGATRVSAAATMDSK